MLETAPQSTAFLRIESNPPGASIHIDDMQTELGTTPFQIERIVPGTHKITLAKEGYESYHSEIVINDNNKNNLLFHLNPLMIDVQILVKPWGSIFIDEILEKQNTNVKYIKTLSQGEHTIKISHPVFGIWEKMVEVTKE